MITKEQAVTATKDYLKARGRSYIYMEQDRVEFTSTHIIAPEGKNNYDLDVAVVSYDIEGYQDPIAFFVYVDSQTGEVLFTRGPHGIVEDRE